MSNSDNSAQAVPPTESEREALTHLNAIKSLREDVIFFENVRKVTTDEPSRESLGRSIEVLRGSQDKLYGSLYVKFGIEAKSADRLVAGKSEADMLTTLRERAAAYGDEAVKVFEHSGQFDAGVLKDLENRAVDVCGVIEHAQPQNAQSSTEQQKLAAELIELKNQEKTVSVQLANRRALSSEAIRALEKAREQKRREYKEKFDTVVKRPDKEQILKLWENAVKLELQRNRETKGREQEKTPSKTK